MNGKPQPPIDWAAIERLMYRVLSTKKATVANMRALTRAFKCDPDRYDAAHKRAALKVEGPSEQAE